MKIGSERIIVVVIAACIALGCRSTPPNPDTPEQLNNTLLAAVRQNRIDDVRAAIARGASPDLIDMGTAHSTTPLLIACERGHMDIVNVLVAAGANPSRREGGGDFGKTPLMVAARFGHSTIVNRLLDAGANVFARSGPWTKPMERLARA